MTIEQITLFAILVAAMALFVWGRWRYDLVALLALLAAVFSGLVPVEHAFSGFGHPAVITVAAVLVISYALKSSGVVDVLVRALAPTRRNLLVQIGAACGLTAGLSAFMNNVGALALMLPVALRNAQKAGRSPSQVLMPLSFASLLGGLVTLIGTPPNIVIAAFRGQATGSPFDMFDFTPVGIVVALAGIVFITLIGWRLIPRHRRSASDDLGDFQIQSYITEARLPAQSALAGRSVRHLEQICQNEATVMAIVRGEQRLLAPRGLVDLRANDILVLEGDPTALKTLFDEAYLIPVTDHKVDPALLRSDQVRIVEAVVMPGSHLEGQSMRGLKMHDRYGVNLLAMARQGRPPEARLGHIRFEVGDVLLLQGERQTMGEVLSALGCLPLAERGITLGRRRQIALPLVLFGTAIAAAAFGLVSLPIALTTAVVGLVVTNSLSIREIYEGIEWPIIILLGALIPVGEALQTTGGTDLIANGIISLAGQIPIWSMLALIMVTSMLLSDLIHNTPTAVLMAPIAIAIARGLELSVDPFLMAVAVGSASPYLTPIGHQSNTLVMGPGGYRFSDYWRLGLPLDCLILCVAVPMILWVWM